MRKTLLFILTILMCMTLSFAVAGGTQDDPLVTLSYITGEYLDNLNKRANERIDELLEQAKNSFAEKLSSKFSEYNQRADQKSYESIIAEKAYEEYLKRNAQSGGTGYAEVTLHEGDILLGGLGTSFVMKSGSGNTYYDGDCAVLNLSEGIELKSSQPLSSGSSYMVASNALCGARSSENYSSFAVFGSYSVKKAYTPQFTLMADGLYNIGLFKGTNSGYELDRSASRIEAVVMLIRLLGEEEEALSFTGENPFDDVDTWADRYAAYAYAKGYTVGVAEGKFAPSRTITADQYTTFLLRALNYDDKAGDFSWDSAVSFAKDTGIFTEDDRAYITNGIFRRDYMVLISCRGLFAKVKDTQARLADRLIVDGTVSASVFDQSENFLKNHR